MTIELYLPDNAPIPFLPGLPKGFKGPLLQGANVVGADTQLAAIVLQQISGLHYYIRLCSGKLLKKMLGKGWIEEYGLYSSFVLKNAVRKDLQSLGKFHIRQDQYISYLSGKTNCSVWFQNTDEFITIDFFYSPMLLKELAPAFPQLQELVQQATQTILNGKACWSVAAMKDIMAQILDCPFHENTRQFYYDLKVRELLYQLLQAGFSKQEAPHFTPFETAKIHEARNILQQSMHQKTPSIASIARQVAINQYKLRVGFQAFFHTGITKWVKEQRMQHAKYLILHSNKPVKEIAALVGYPHTANFITAFKKRFNITPGELRR